METTNFLFGGGDMTAEKARNLAKEHRFRNIMEKIENAVREGHTAAPVFAGETDDIKSHVMGKLRDLGYNVCVKDCDWIAVNW